MRRASVALLAPAPLSKVTAGVEASPTFVDLSTSSHVYSGGMASPVTAIMPDKVNYERIRVSFGKPTLVTATDAILDVVVERADGSAVVVGTSDLTAGILPAVEFDNEPGKIAVQVRTLTGGGSITVKTFVQGVYKQLFVSVN